MLGNLFGFRRTADRVSAAQLYEAIVAAARQPFLYEEIGVTDTPLGRFEMVALHMVLFLRRIRNEGPAIANLGQVLTDDFFLDVDHSLRELGIGDMGVPKRMKKLARMFYGRAKSYTEALDGNDRAALAEALRRNVMPERPSWPGAAALATYMAEAAHALDRQSAAEIEAGRVIFSPGLLRGSS